CLASQLNNESVQTRVCCNQSHRFHQYDQGLRRERFLPFLDMFQKDSVRVEVCKSIMEVFINSLTLEDEKRSLAMLIIGFVRMVSFGRDFEQQLSFCVEARATFCNLEPVLVQLIHLAMETRRVMRGNHSRKTAAFVRVRTLEYIKHQAQQPDMAHLSDTIQRLVLQSRT
ncbi:VPS35 endosomal protein-sorting factor-like, partial [Goodea atripinnis]